MTLADVERKAVKEAGFGICVDVAEQDQGPRGPPQEEACAWGWGEVSRGGITMYALCLSLKKAEGWMTLCGGLFTEFWHYEQPPHG